jgi:hypothetical protein
VPKRLLTGEGRAKLELLLSDLTDRLDNSVAACNILIGYMSDEEIYKDLKAVFKEFKKAKSSLNRIDRFMYPKKSKDCRPRKAKK